MKEAPGSSETSVLTRATRRNNPEDTILHSHRSENLKSYTTSSFTYKMLCINHLHKSINQWINKTWLQLIWHLFLFYCDTRSIWSTLSVKHMCGWTECGVGSHISTLYVYIGSSLCVYKSVLIWNNIQASLMWSTTNSPYNVYVHGTGYLYHVTLPSGSLEETVTPQRDLVIKFPSESYRVKQAFLFLRFRTGGKNVANF
jgi:hypothetical protein